MPFIEEFNFPYASISQIEDMLNSKRNKFSVMCKTYEQWEEILAFCEKRGYKWMSHDDAWYYVDEYNPRQDRYTILTFNHDRKKWYLTYQNAYVDNPDENPDTDVLGEIFTLESEPPIITMPFEF